MTPVSCEKEGPGTGRSGGGGLRKQLGTKRVTPPLVRLTRSIYLCYFFYSLEVVLFKMFCDISEGVTFKVAAITQDY